MAPCGLCGKPSNKLCSKCCSVTYCNRKHQNKDWFRHRRNCKAAQSEKNENKDDKNNNISEKSKEDTIAMLVSAERHYLESNVASMSLADHEFSKNDVSPHILDVLSFTLHIETDKEPKQFPGMLNQYCEKDTKVVKITVPHVFKYGEDYDLFADELEERDEFCDYLVELSDKELDVCAYKSKSVRLSCGEYFAPEGKDYFSIKDLVEAICENEETDRAREESLWFGGIDCHHIFFEGMSLDCWGNYYHVSWGS